ncbi:MAG: bifunctional glutamate N-acetyltransferase/amino-acid acetyltransferase ArgJ [Gammaproteobacteria bacterium]|nr:bifunctional glutamate N-acetyltransferase/amino-acid acetyltransferase ArgJ [Gammaproteobacteria bacterium]MBU1654954.1 bifunctional glutamate N-acetyltransferase/amino-acid acetyltransferase ArgJ [Gammaproteobacteria bacterium]MBU1961725.1 bifunctional glutamate N-acetyltransferase/amino-acid acetyltransferase ArgJ [Gammaproteobacteria bacterium]
MVEKAEEFSVGGIRLSACAAGIRYRGRDDLVLMEIAEGGTCAGVFTTNAFCAAPVIVAREHLVSGSPRYLLINSGNANAGTGEPGLRACRESCRFLAAAAGCALNQVLPFSTGVIGQDLPVERIASAVPELIAGLSVDGWERASRAIMTTDTVPKLASRRLDLGGRTVRVTGMAKGSGMIRPDMATMLAYLATDAQVPKALLQACLEQAVAPSFNAITVDGDTSTNDACILVASGQSGVGIADLESGEGRRFAAAVADVCMELARAIIRDGEGATKLVEVAVREATSVEEARAVAYTVAHSPLVKTALFASDPNWGRILAAVGRAPLANLDVNGVRIWLDDVCIVSKGGRDPAYEEAAGQGVMGRPEFQIRIALGRGAAAAKVLTCDFSFDYVKINAEYRS